ncbi:hypothetical protein BH10PSE2_BH10PSE2_18900 [soil metagenome]
MRTISRSNAGFVALAGIAVLTLAGCAPATDGAAAAEADLTSGPRLGMRTDVVLAPGDEGWGKGGWLVITPTGSNPGPGPNPAHVMGSSGQIDLNGDGVPETVQARLGGAAWSEFTVFDSDKPDAKVLFRGDGIDLLVSKQRDAGGWPIMAMLTRDFDSKDIGAQKVMPDQTWNGAGYSAQGPIGPSEAPPAG